MNVHDQPSPVRFERIIDRLDDRRGIGRIVQAIKSGNEVKALIIRNRVAVRIVACTMRLPCGVSVLFLSLFCSKE